MTSLLDENKTTVTKYIHIQDGVKIYPTSENNFTTTTKLEPLRYGKRKKTPDRSSKEFVIENKMKEELTEQKKTERPK